MKVIFLLVGWNNKFTFMKVIFLLVGRSDNTFLLSEGYYVV